MLASWLGGCLLVIIGDFNVMCVAILPAEADAPLLVDADAVLPTTVSLERFQAIGGRYFQVFQ